MSQIRSMSRAWALPLIVVLGSSAARQPAIAADLPANFLTKASAYSSALYNWGGGYGGIEGGYGWGRSSQIDPGIPTVTTTTTTPPAPPPPPPGPPPPPLPSADGRYSVDGGLVGGTLGYNWQKGRWVFGVEGDLSWADVKGQSTLCGQSTGTAHSCGTSLNSLGTVRGRVGYAIGATGNWLLYGTGGFAAGDVRGWDALTPASGRALRPGWTLGAGVETAFAANWTAKLEYLYVDLGNALLFNVVPGVPETVNFRSNIVRAGVAYHFGGPVVAKY